MRTQVIALDAAGKPLAGRAVSVDVFERKSYSNRRRLIGGFYAYDTTTETKRIGSGCSGTTDSRGLLFSTVKPRCLGSCPPVSNFSMSFAVEVPAEKRPSNEMLR